jgi:hypothetical protein
MRVRREFEDYRRLTQCLTGTLPAERARWAAAPAPGWASDLRHPPRTTKSDRSMDSQAQEPRSFEVVTEQGHRVNAA